MNFDDLKNLDLKNLNVEDLKQKVLAFADKKTLIKVGISLGSIIVFLIIYYAILNPIVEKKRNQINDMNTKQEEITKFDLNTRTIQHYFTPKLKLKVYIKT